MMNYLEKVDNQIITRSGMSDKSICETHSSQFMEKVPQGSVLCTHLYRKGINSLLFWSRIATFLECASIFKLSIKVLRM